MGIVVEVLSQLEKYAITKEALEVLLSYFYILSLLAHLEMAILTQFAKKFCEFRDLKFL